MALQQRQAPAEIDSLRSPLYDCMHQQPSTRSAYTRFHRSWAPLVDPYTLLITRLLHDSRSEEATCSILHFHIRSRRFRRAAVGPRFGGGGGMSSDTPQVCWKAFVLSLLRCYVAAAAVLRVVCHSRSYRWRCLLLGLLFIASVLITCTDLYDTFFFYAQGGSLIMIHGVYMRSVILLLGVTSSHPPSHKTP
jgi:hypothetical protein